MPDFPDLDGYPAVHRLFALAVLIGGSLPVIAIAQGASAIAVPAGGPAVLPRPSEPFTGHIGQTYADSTAAFPHAISAPSGAPNVVVILGDDIGFGVASTFGGPVPTPNLDRLAGRGLVYNRFHTTAMCSPTRAALLTGRNHHAVGNGIVANLSTGFPGYNNLLPRSAATLAEVLRQNGYNTAMFGKHHNTPEQQVSPAGPFDLWPTGLGFEYFYGFVFAETNQFTPALYRGTTPIPTLSSGVLDQALADETIHWIHSQQAAAPDKPFFAYLATGSAHAPLQAPADWIARFKGQFDVGYDVIRARTVERQKQMGLIPPDTVPSPRPEGIPAWQALTPARQRINARFMEVYAAMVAYQDHEVGRVLDELARMEIDGNTLVVWITGDNGAAAEGRADGASNPMASFANGFNEDEATLLANLDKIGGPDAVGNVGYGWAWANNAPFPYVKQIASHLGGTRNGMVVSWPGRITEPGIRSQFGHVTDIVPTVLEAAGIAMPEIVNGTPQQPVDGVSLAYTFRDAGAPERHRTQYFEMMGNRAIYQDGWMASTTPVNAAWHPLPGSHLPTDYQWELYDLSRDFSQAQDIAAKNPGKLAELRAVFDTEAARNGVFPLDDRLKLERFRAAESQLPRRNHYTYWSTGLSVPVMLAAPLTTRSFKIVAELDLPEKAQTAPLVAVGSQFGGWAFYLDRGRPVALVSASQLARDQHRVVAVRRLRAGRTKLEFEFLYDGGVNAGGEMVIRVDDQEIGRGRLAGTFAKYPEMTDTFDIGFDADTPVTKDYPSGARFQGRVIRLDVTVGKPGAVH